ncbi:MAG: HAMP domain-containing protein [Deltaproteobacteria bacterium]|nr:MAG: HAMP domain-containing protein [Deltaproteobacteria bacterium]
MPKRMPRFLLHSLHAKLQLFSLVLVVVPGALFALIALARARGALEHAVGQQLGEVAHEALEELAGALAGERNDVRTWARQDVMRDVMIGDLDKRASRFLRSLTDGGAPYLDLLCIDRDGRVVAASDPSWLGQMLGDRDWARTALRGEDFLRGPIGASDHAPPAVEIAAPIRVPEQTDTVIGALLGRYDWQKAIALATRIRRTLIPHGLRVNVLLLDRRGAVIGESWGEDLGAETVGKLRAAGAQVAPSLDASRRRGYVADAQAGVLVGFERADHPEFGWVALVMEPLAEAFAPVRDMERRLAVALAAVLLVAFAVATFLGGRMSRPLRALTLATQEIAHATEPRRPLEVRSRDEIGQLAVAFNTMTAELKRAQDDLVTAAKFAFVGEVAAGVAHEVRTPLGILRTSAQILARSVPPGPESAELVQMIIEEVDRLDHVVAGLLELARPRQPLIETTPLAPLLARALNFVERQAREKNITLRHVFGADPCPARCDPEQIYQVALNLIVNALQMVPGGGHITVRTLPHHDGHVAFEVIDDGPGIPPDAQEHVFTPFFTLRPGGTGLGLALVQRMVRAHQGSVSVDSTVGRGTTFRVELPAA